MADSEIQPELVEDKDLYTPGPDAVDISPAQDRGVLKEVLQVGTGDETPQNGNKVFVHYTGKLLDGTVFDSSRDRDDLFDFTLGRGQVIRAWDIGVATMKKGEVCMLTCDSEYAYGKSGSPPKIPADATLVFEVELFKWELEELLPMKGGGIKRSIITEGEGSEKPNDEAAVEVHLTGKFSGKVFEDKDVKFQLGEGFENGVVDGIEIALKHFVKGEKSRIVLDPKFAFGKAGKPEFSIPPNSEVEYEVTLIAFEKAKESWEMDTDEKLEQSEIVKTRGTKYFKMDLYDKAVNQYKKIVDYLQYESGLEEGKGDKRNALLLAGYLNLSACFLKLNEHAKAIENADKALEIEANNVKGLFRRGQAHFALNDYEIAKADFQKAFEVDPSNKAAQKQYLVCNEQIKKQLEKEKKLYRNMFQKLSEYSDNIKDGINNGSDLKIDGAAEGTSPDKMDINEKEQAEAAKA